MSFFENVIDKIRPETPEEKIMHGVEQVGNKWLRENTGISIGRSEDDYTKMIIYIVVGVVGGMLLLAICGCMCRRRHSQIAHQPFRA